MQNFSALNRNENLVKASSEHFDVLIIGGGITGAGIALDAASRGLKVLLLEKNDFSSGTSSKSTKLIHGGLRYLKQLEFGLVHSVGRERAVIHKLAKQIVKPVDMLLPIYKNGSLGKYSTALALRIYDFLAGVKKEDRFKMFNLSETKKMEPFLNTNGLIGSALYKEYQTDDARLTIEVLKTAATFDALSLNYALCENFIYDKKNTVKIIGVEFRDTIQNKMYSATATKIINAAGPWVDEIRLKDPAPDKKSLHLTKGVHVVIDKNKFPIQHAIYFDVPGDNRMIFAIPRGNMVYVGTTDTNYFGNKDLIDVTSEDVSYLIDAINAVFSGVQISQQDILSSWAGLRPLIHEEGKSPSELSRKDEIFIADSGLVSIAGGKLTGYRKMAEKVVNKIVKVIEKTNQKSYSKCRTASIQLHGSAIEIPIEEYIQRRAGEASQINFTLEDVFYLVNTYGSDTEKIIEIGYANFNKLENKTESLVRAELQYSVEYEMTNNISDFAIRRTGRLYFDKRQLENNYKKMHDIISTILNESSSQKNDNLLFFEEVLRRSAAFENVN